MCRGASLLLNVGQPLTRVQPLPASKMERERETAELSWQETFDLEPGEEGCDVG